MTPSIEQQFDAFRQVAPLAADKFLYDLRACYPTQAFQSIIATLCRFAHPLSSPLQESAMDTGVAIGRREVIAFLIAYGSDQEVPTVLTKSAP